MIDPGNPNHILAGSLDAATSGVSIIGSSDGGGTWGASDAGLSGKDIKQVLFYPPDPAYVFALSSAADPGDEGQVYRSTDGGLTWVALASLPTAHSLLYSPQTTPMLLAIRADGLYTSTNKGGTWNSIAGPSCAGVPAAVGTDDPNVIYSSIVPYIATSTDLGQTCTTSVKGLLAMPVAGLGVAPSNPATVYAGTISGLYKSTDAGETWELVRSGQFPGIAVDPVDGNTVYVGAAEFAQALKSTDGGHGPAHMTCLLCRKLNIHPLTSQKVGQ